MKIYQHYSVYGFSNGYVVCNEDSMEALIIDPGEVTTTMIDQIEHKTYAVKAVLITHSHTHHCRGLKTLMRIYDPEVYASNTKLFNIVCRKVQDQQLFKVANFPIRAIAVPGHTQDSIVYDIDGCLFTGDAFHAGIIGKTTSAFNAKALYERLKSKLEFYPDDSLVFPGHGPPSTLGTEKKFNLGLREGFAESLKASYDFFV
jgi:glyoxylase-like metal-dependent hydrolase (beta-lactamase superfamily II)